MNLVKIYKYFQEKRLNLIEHSIKIGDITWSYYDNYQPDDEREVIILFHGFLSDKTFSWYPLIKSLKSKYRIIILDMLGHGKTKIDNDTLPFFDFAAENQILYLKSVINMIIGVDIKFHLVGSSLGGLIAGLFATKYAYNVKTLILIAPFGISVDNSIVEKTLKEKNKNLFIFDTLQDGLNLYKISAYNKPSYLSSMISNAIFNDWYGDIYIPNKFIYNTIISDNYPKHNNTLQSELYKLDTPTLIVWGKNDKLLSANNVNILDEILSNLDIYHNMNVIDNCGHSCHIEYPELCSELIQSHITTSKIINE